MKKLSDGRLVITARNGHTILLGSVGGDAHSVGLNIMRGALSENKYRVRYLGSQNRLDDFFEYAHLSNVVMISSMDGHAWRYLREFPAKLLNYSTTNNVPLWYLGGNLTIGDSIGHEMHFRDMGFSRVFVKFVDIRDLLRTLRRDLHGVDPMAENAKLWGDFYLLPKGLPNAPAEELLPYLDLERIRKEVLLHWKTGYEAESLEDNAEFLINQPSVPRVQQMVNEGKGQILIQPRSGVALVNEQIKIFTAFKSVGISVLSYQVDSLTRNNNYAGVEDAIRESRNSLNSVLNGYPIVNHGVSALRRIISEVELPLQTRHSARDPRLLAEISYAGGVTAFEGGAICYNIPYFKLYPLDEAIRVWQYVDRLTGLYYERFGIVLDREFFGTLTGTLVPPCLAIVTCILETILAIQQGVRCVSLGYAEQGNRIQDIAAIRTMHSMASKILSNMSYENIQINTLFHQYMAAFPTVPGRAEELIYNSAVTAALSGATRVLVKTPVEAYKIPTLADNLEGISLVMTGIRKAREETVDEVRIAEEGEVIRREVQAIFDSILCCGDGNIIEGIIQGFENGFIDIPFSPSVYNAGKVMTARDKDGAVRFLSSGNLQFDRETVEFHRDKMDSRRRSEGIAKEEQGYLLLEKDVLQITRGQYERWPLSG